MAFGSIAIHFNIGIGKIQKGRYFRNRKIRNRQQMLGFEDRRPGCGLAHQNRVLGEQWVKGKRAKQAVFNARLTTPAK